MNIHHIYRYLFAKGGWRAKRMAIFRERLHPTDTTTILDVGGYAGYWETLLPIRPQVTLLNLDPEVLNYRRPENMVARVGDATNMREFADGAFEIAHSNSVIEHLYTWDAQRRFATEIRRVGRSVWVQTPARAFPFEPHFLTPFIHWLPKSLRKRLARGTVSALAGRWTPEKARGLVDEIRLLSLSEFRTLFPDCEIQVERFLGMPKSYIALRAVRTRRSEPDKAPALAG